MYLRCTSDAIGVALPKEFSSEQLFYLLSFFSLLVRGLCEEEVSRRTRRIVPKDFHFLLRS